MGEPLETPSYSKPTPAPIPIEEAETKTSGARETSSDVPSGSVLTAASDTPQWTALVQMRCVCLRQIINQTHNVYGPVMHWSIFCSAMLERLPVTSRDLTDVHEFKHISFVGRCTESLTRTSQ